MFRKALSMLLVIALLCGMTSVSASAETVNTDYQNVSVTADSAPSDNGTLQLTTEEAVSSEDYKTFTEDSKKVSTEANSNGAAPVQEEPALPGENAEEATNIDNSATQVESSEESAEAADSKESSSEENLSEAVGKTIPEESPEAGSSTEEEITPEEILPEEAPVLRASSARPVNVSFDWDIRDYLYGYSANYGPDWNKAAALGITVPDKVTLTLCEDGKPMNIEGASVDISRENGAWPDRIRQTWTLPSVDEEGKPIKYGKLSVEYPAKPDGYYLSLENVNTYNDGSVAVNASSWIPAITNPAISFPLTWDDSDNGVGLRPEKLSVTLLANGEPFGKAETVTLTSGGQIKSMPDDWLHLPMLDKDGNFVKYTLKFNDLPFSYTASEEDCSPAWTKDYGYCGEGNSKPKTLRDKVSQGYRLSLGKTQSLKTTILWEGDGIGTDAEKAARPDSIELKLLYSSDNGTIWKEFWGKADYSIPGNSYQNRWELELKGLPSVDENGQSVIYKVEQTNQLTAYQTTADDPIYTKTEGTVTGTECVIHNAYNDNWNYAISLIWDVNDGDKYNINTVTLDNTSYTAKYTLSVSTQKPYPARSLEIRLPYELFDKNRSKYDTTGTIPGRISIGREGQETDEFSYTYRIEDKGTPDTSDDEIVFYNYKDVGTENFRVTVEYTLEPYDIPDCVTSRLTAEATGTYQGQTSPEKQVSNTITYRMDTGVELTKAAKAGEKNVYFWNTKYGEKPADFDPSRYNYVLYQFHIENYSNNQPARIVMTDTPEDGGEVYKVLKGLNFEPLEFTTDKETGTGQWTFSTITSGRNNWSVSDNAYVMVRYPRIEQEDPLNPGQTTYETTYYNRGTVSIQATDPQKEMPDYNDVSTVEVSASQNWKDYEFHYNGNLFDGSKTFRVSTGYGITNLEYGKDLTANVNINMSGYGYNLPNGYQLCEQDDALYARATIGGKKTDYIRLTEKDYEYTGEVRINATFGGTDRTTGEMYALDPPDEPFILYGRVSEKAEWVKIAEFTYPKGGEPWDYHTVADISGKGYTALRIESPEGLKDRAYYNAYLQLTFKPSSPLFQSWIKSGGDDLSSISLLNLAAFEMYTKDNDGNQIWLNGYPSSTNSMAAKVGLDDSDLKEKGAYRYRRNDGAEIGRASFYGRKGKAATSSSYNPTDKTVSTRFALWGCEQTGNGLPEEVYHAKSHDEAVFYDLLPEGFYYDASKEVTVNGGINFYNVQNRSNGYQTPQFEGQNNKASLISVDTKDNYQGSGRQLVIFSVASTAAKGENWSYTTIGGAGTGFAVWFYATASYDDVQNGERLYNYMAYQKKDASPMAGGSKEDGNKTINGNEFPKTEDGQWIFNDINGDGKVSDELNTFYGLTNFQVDKIESIQNGLRKSVKGNSGLYKSEDTTSLNGNYSYKININAQKNGTTNNIILYDILENAANTDGHAGESEGWKGVLRSVDTSAAVRKGAHPVVYYSTAANLSYNDPDGLLLEKKPDIWTTQMPEDPSEITAVAIDLRKAENGGDFVLAQNSSLNIILYMQAPDKLQTSDYAYNRAAYNSTFCPEGSTNATTSFNICPRTRIGLYDLQEIRFVKQVVNDDGEPVAFPNVTFTLYRCTEQGEGHVHYGTPGSSQTCWKEKVGSEKSNAYGEVVFRDLPTGEYAVCESQTPVNNVANSTNSRYWLYHVDSRKGTVSGPEAVSSSKYSDPIEMKWNDSLKSWVLLNTRKTINVYVHKTWEDDAAHVIRPKTLTFELYRNGVKIDTKTVATGNGKTETYKPLFENLNYADMDGKAYTYSVKEAGVEGYLETAPETANWYYGDVSFTNKRLGILELSKIVKGQETDRTFQFDVTLKGADKSPVSGRFTAYRLKDGVLQENSEQVDFDETGKAVINLKHGETLRLIGLPIDAAYTVAEEQMDIYSSEVTSGVAEGTLSSTKTAAVTFTNTERNLAILPKTGGGGTWTFHLLGALVMGGSVLGLALLAKKKNVRT